MPPPPRPSLGPWDGTLVFRGTETDTDIQNRMEMEIEVEWAHTYAHAHCSGCIAEVGMEGGDVSPLVTGPGSVWSEKETKFHGTKADE